MNHVVQKLNGIRKCRFATRYIVASSQARRYCSYCHSNPSAFVNAVLLGLLEKRGRNMKTCEHLFASSSKAKYLVVLRTESTQSSQISKCQPLNICLISLLRGLCIGTIRMEVCELLCLCWSLPAICKRSARRVSQSSMGVRSVEPLADSRAKTELWRCPTDLRMIRQSKLIITQDCHRDHARVSSFECHSNCCLTPDATFLEVNRDDFASGFSAPTETPTVQYVYPKQEIWSWRKKLIILLVYRLSRMIATLRPILNYTAGSHRGGEKRAGAILTVSALAKALHGLSCAVNLRLRHGRLIHFPSEYPWKEFDTLVDSLVALVVRAMHPSVVGFELHRKTFRVVYSEFFDPAAPAVWFKELTMIFSALARLQIEPRDSILRILDQFLDCTLDNDLKIALTVRDMCVLMLSLAKLSQFQRLGYSLRSFGTILRAALRGGTNNTQCHGTRGSQQGYATEEYIPSLLDGASLSSVVSISLHCLPMLQYPLGSAGSVFHERREMHQLKVHIMLLQCETVRTLQTIISVFSNLYTRDKASKSMDWSDDSTSKSTETAPESFQRQICTCMIALFVASTSERCNRAMHAFCETLRLLNYEDLLWIDRIVTPWTHHSIIASDPPHAEENICRKFPKHCGKVSKLEDDVFNTVQEVAGSVGSQPHAFVNASPKGFAGKPLNNIPLSYIDVQNGRPRYIRRTVPVSCYNIDILVSSVRPGGVYAVNCT